MKQQIEKNLEICKPTNLGQVQFILGEIKQKSFLSHNPHMDSDILRQIYSRIPVQDRQQQMNKGTAPKRRKKTHQQMKVNGPRRCQRHSKSTTPTAVEKLTSKPYSKTTLKRNSNGKREPCVVLTKKNLLLRHYDGANKQHRWLN